MEYLIGILLFLFYYRYNIVIVGLIGYFHIVILITLSVFLGLYYPIVGFALLLNSFWNSRIMYLYIRQNKKQTNIPIINLHGANLYIATYTCIIFTKAIYPIEYIPYIGLYIAPSILVLWKIYYSIATYIKRKRKLGTPDYIVKYKFVEKYDTDPKWAIYIYYDNGHEEWVKAIKGANLERSADDDTLVFADPSDAELYAQFFLKNVKKVK